MTADVTCSVCGKQVKRAAAVGVNGAWSCAGAKCLGQALRKLPTVRDVGDQLGLFAGERRGPQQRRPRRA